MASANFDLSKSSWVTASFASLKHNQYHVQYVKKTTSKNVIFYCTKDKSMLKIHMSSKFRVWIHIRIYQNIYPDLNYSTKKVVKIYFFMLKW